MTDSISSLKQRKFMARYGREVPDLPDDDDMSWEDAHVMAASMHNPNASEDHIIRGGFSYHFVICDAAVKAYRKRHPNRQHPAVVVE